MIIIAGKKYISEKEASNLYNFSQSWFKKRRVQKLPPRFVKLEHKKTGRAYYPLDEIEEWFKRNFEGY